MPAPNENAPLPFDLPDPDPIQDTQPNITEKKYRGRTVDSRYQKLASLITHIEGSKWTTTYFSQVSGSSDQPSPNNPGQHPVYQQYIQINDLEFKVDSELDMSQNQDNDMVVRGTGVTYPKFIPNVGDTFFADVGDGREGIFHINEVNKLSIMKEACYQIEYQMTGYVSELAAFAKDITDKVIKTVFYRRDFLRFGQYPLLLEEEVLSVTEMQRMYRQLVHRYVNEFYDSQNSTFIVPDVKPTYDDFAVEAFLAITNVTDHPTLRRVSRLAIMNDNITNEMTVWKMLIEGQGPELIHTVIRKMWSMSRKQFLQWPVYGSVYHSRVERVVWPNGSHPHDDTWQTHYVAPTASEELEPPPANGSGVGFPQTIYQDYDFDAPAPSPGTPPPAPQPPQDPPLVKPAHGGGHYLFSNAFYNDVEGEMSGLEVIVWEAIRNEAYDPQMVVTIAKEVDDWDAMDRYYYIPIVMALLKIAIRRF